MVDALKEIIAVYSENYTKPYIQKEALTIVEAGGIYGYH
jgi:hypothetical protein